jgi:hypothetical protein
MLHVLARDAIRTAVSTRLQAEATYAANAPFHIAEGKGLSFYADFLARMDAIINPPDPTRDPLADAEVAAFERMAAHFGG